MQLRYPGMRGGANGGSLHEYQLQALAEHPADVRATDGFSRHPEWRPLTDSERILPTDGHDGSGIGYFNSASEILVTYYWSARETGS